MDIEIKYREIKKYISIDFVLTKAITQVKLFSENFQVFIHKIYSPVVFSKVISVFRISNPDDDHYNT